MTPDQLFAQLADIAHAIDRTDRPQANKLAELMPHVAALIEERRSLIMQVAQTAQEGLQLAAAAMKRSPIDMVLHCPNCGMQHIDKADDIGCDLPRVDQWTNPPHRTHRCARCNHHWRPADVPTNGVWAVRTRGAHDSPIVGNAVASRLATDRTKRALRDMEARKDAAYLERNQVVAALAKWDDPDTAEKYRRLAALGEPTSEHEKAQHDAKLFGAGFMVDGKRVAPQRVRAFLAPEPVICPLDDKPCRHLCDAAGACRQQ